MGILKHLFGKPHTKGKPEIEASAKSERYQPVTPQSADASEHSKKAAPDFIGSAAYWEKRYVSGRSSGAGSYNKLAEFKAEFLNNFVRTNNVGHIVEFGSGDGNQLRLAEYTSYTGYDVSETALENCRTMFAMDASKSFRSASAYDGETADLSISLDVIYHLVEDDIFASYMTNLFQAATRFVIVYSSNEDKPQKQHVRQRRFTDWVEKERPDWKLIAHVPNRHPYNEADLENSSFADFYVFSKS